MKTEGGSSELREADTTALGGRKSKNELARGIMGAVAEAAWWHGGRKAGATSFGMRMQLELEKAATESGIGEAWELSGSSAGA